MFAFLSEILQKKHIDTFAPVPLSACHVVRPYLLERAGISDGTAIMLAIPYYTHAAADPERNLSAYAVSRDYHLFFSALFQEILPILREQFPAYRFAGFADHSPIDEIHAAASAGLGVLGDNHMLLTERYSSYVFLGEIITDERIDCAPQKPQRCEGCGACMRACPARDGSLCLSALTQKKGVLTPDEERRLLAHNTVWGCDICQEVCPHTRRAFTRGTIFSPIPFFSTDTIPHLSAASLAQMSDEAFEQRAYAWRRRETIGRNLALKEKGEPTC
ncbi:MAG: epoxyqueuosine reductase [Clostridia bacterium]|nr:epoxyqueuosine reductase [Clostridia bacterium]